MTKTSIGLQELRKRIAQKAKAEPLHFVSWQVEQKVRRFASRQRPKSRGRHWAQWSHQTVYREWGLYSDYRTRWRQLNPAGNAT
jgi:hypothetical protein